MKVRAHIKVYGDVQGVGYRYFAKRLAYQYGILGWVKNNIDGSVELDIEGEKKDIEDYTKKLKTDHPWATVTDIEIEWLNYSGIFSNFFIK